MAGGALPWVSEHEYRIFLDPVGEHIFPEPDAKKVEWWALVVREDMENGVWRHVVHRAKRTLAEVKRDAEQWEGQPHDKARGRTRTDEMLPRRLFTTPCRAHPPAVKQPVRKPPRILTQFNARPGWPAKPTPGGSSQL